MTFYVFQLFFFTGIFHKKPHNESRENAVWCLLDEDKNFQSCSVSHLLYLLSFSFFIKSDAATQIVFPALIFNPDTWELSPSQCEGLSQALPG